MPSRLFFDIIRFDFNDNRSCIALRSKRNPEYPEQVTIPVGRKCGDFAILQTCVGGKPGDAVLKYRIRYADGTVQEKTAVKGMEICDWKIDANPAALQKTAVWSDEEHYGFFLYELPNPFPSKTVANLELLSCGGDGTAVICAISALETIFTREYAHSVSFKELFPVLKKPKPDARNGWFGDEFRSDQSYVEFATRDGKPHPLFDTPEKMRRAMDFWRTSWEQGWFVRWAIALRSEVIGTVELCRREESPDDPYSGMGILRVDVGSAWEKSDVLAAVMDALLPDAYALFNCRTLMTKAAPYAVARVATLTECGFVRSDKPVMGHHGERFEYYWVREK